MTTGKKKKMVAAHQPHQKVVPIGPMRTAGFANDADHLRVRGWRYLQKKMGFQQDRPRPPEPGKRSSPGR